MVVTQSHDGHTVTWWSHNHMMVTQSQVICFKRSTGLHYFLSTRMKANRKERHWIGYAGQWNGSEYTAQGNKHHTYTLCPYTFTLTQAAKIRCCLRDGLQHVASGGTVDYFNIP
ncbi:hypothetical protein EB796_018902 [Bugula neritina]|uniref:Uncharacterized protein n=1 Tax=Bugula neritina TaxID=10212 RepID=A0A7J7J987_BUGNE|nr:hypothetical protein EB796_018902 [Bugula neritina]